MQDILANVPKRLLLAYIFDWIVIIVVAIIGYGFSKATPNSNPFSLTDGSISYPFKKHETVPSHVQVFISLVGPATIIALLVLALIPGSAVSRNAPRSLKWRYRIWECNAGWMGLAVALAGAYTATHGLKNLVGKPRPDFLARCDPDLSKITAYAVGGLGQQLEGAPTLVTWEICQNKSNKLRSAGFSSFPSGHSSFAFAGMTYLTLWLCSKFSIAFPYLAHCPVKHDLEDEERVFPFHTGPAENRSPSIRNEGAAPPAYTLIIALVPISVATFIAASRWFDHRHHGVDIVSGSAIGIFFAWIGFRLYNLPIKRGAGWSWGARNSRHAFYKGVGIPSHTGSNNWASEQDTENRILV